MKSKLLGLISACLTAGAWAPAAHAEYTLTLEEVGADVVATGSGSLNLASLTPVFDMTGWPNMLEPATATIGVGPSSGDASFHGGGVTSPASLGSGGATYATSGSGGLVGMYQGIVPFLMVPLGYVSGTLLGTSQTTYAGKSFASLGLEPGQYVWSWGAGETSDTFTVQVGPAPGGGAPGGANLDALKLKVGAIGKVGTSLTDKLTLAEAYFAVPDLAAGCSMMSAFLAQVNALAGKKFTDAQASEFATDATNVMTAEGCQ